MVGPVVRVVERVLEVFRSSFPLVLLSCDVFSVLVFDRSSGVAVFPRKCPRYLVQSFHVKVTPSL
jgi:hypothetical protein